MTDHQANREAMSPPRPPGLGMEIVAALAGTAFVAILLVLTAMYAGPLWRDEVNTANVAQMPSLRELWNNLPFESFPPLWPLLLRGCGWLGLAGSDASIRVLGLYVGLFFLASLWLCARWIGSRAPILSIALLGCLPAFVFTVGANRAYGLASGLLVLGFGLIWRVVESPSRPRIFLAGIVCVLFAQCVYYDIVFLGAMLAGGALVAIRRRQWKMLGALAGIGAVAGASLAIYLPIIHRGSAYVPLMQIPFFTVSTLWDRFGDAVTLRSTAELGRNGPEIWLWILLILGGSIAAMLTQPARPRQTLNPQTSPVATDWGRADLALFCAVSMLGGVAGLLAFLAKLHYWTQPWYYVEMLCLCAISLDGLLGANWPALRPWGLLRIGFMVLLMAWGARPAWAEAHTRRSDVDLIAAVLNQSAAKGDLIVVQTAWEGITFDRYYHGLARWVTVPPFDSHKVHRSDLMFENMQQQLRLPEPMAPVMLAITNTLHDGNSVWLLGNMLTMYPKPTPSSDLPLQWYGTYVNYWSGQVTAQLLSHARQEQVVNTPADEPVCSFENLPLIRFSGYKSGSDEPTIRK